MSFDLIASTEKFKSFLAEHNVIMPSKAVLNPRDEMRILDGTNNSSNVILTYFSTTRSLKGNEFIKLHWFNQRSDDKFFIPDADQKELSAEERRKQRKEKQLRDKQIEIIAAKNREIVYKEYLACGIPCKHHSYLEKKNVYPYYGVKYATKSFTYDDEGIERFRIRKGDLIIPIVSLEKEFLSYQRINHQGKKLMAKDSSKSGGIYPIGLWEQNQKQRVILCEGYATGASLYEATRETVLVCFDLGNIRIVCEKLRQDYPDVEIIIAADFDVHSKDQAGLINGLLLAQQFNLKFIFPSCVQDGSDWNDLYLQAGIDSIIRTIDTQLDVFDSKTVDEVIVSYLPLLNEKNAEKLAA